MHLITLICFLLASGTLLAQDERYFRDIFSGALQRKINPDVEKPKIEVRSAGYRFDLNDDGLPEIIRSSKRDNVDWFEIYDFRDSLIFETALDTQGINAGIYKANVVSISPTVKAIILHFYEGFTESTQFDGTARIYVLTFENNNLNKITVTKGPHFFHEFAKVREQYWRRPMRVNVIDYDKDGTKEISTSYGDLQYVIQYLGKGQWKKI
jgi:hypothetical protein